MYVSEVTTQRPSSYRSDVEKKIYDKLEELHIPFERVDNDPAITMDDCQAIDQRLQVENIKTLFLCNRQKTKFYLCVMRAHKPFVTKDFGQALGIARVSFAPVELLNSMLETEQGGTSVLSTLLDPDGQIQVVVDAEVLDLADYGGTDSTTTCYMKMKMDDVMNIYLPAVGHPATIVSL